jgi:DNA-binding SARP family transcriptional activator
MAGASRSIDGARLAADRVAVLGPVSVGKPDALRPVVGRAARLLLALAANPRSRTLDALAEAAWGSQPPATARAALHVHLGTLRRVLAEVGAGIVRSDEGYAIDLVGCELDATLAADLLAESRRLLERDPSAALSRAEQALALWRGTPFAVGGDVVEVTAGHQAEALRRDGEELRIEALLRLGDTLSAEREALRAVQAEPLREHRWGQLLRARYLAGRTGEALSTYQQARVTLIEALGIEPGPDLQELERAVLTHDAGRLRLFRADDSPLISAPPIARPIVGRDFELARLEAILASSRGAVVLGPPGVGKSRVALEAGRRLAKDELAWIDLREPVAATTEWFEPVLDWARRHPEGVVVLDNAEATRDAIASAVADLLQRAPKIRVLVTSRVPLAIDLPIELLAPLATPSPAASDDIVEASSAVQLFRAALQDVAPDVVLPSEEAATLARWSGGLPLTLRLCAATARSVSASAIVALPPSVPGDQIDDAVRAVLAVVDDETQAVFADLSTLSGEFDADLGARVAGIERARFTSVLVTLVDHGLLQPRPDRRDAYAMLEPIRAVGERLLDESQRRDLVCDRHVDACIAATRGVERAAIDGDVEDLEARLSRGMPHHRQALNYLTRTADPDRALALVCGLELPLYTLGWWTEKVHLFDQALAIPGPATPMRARAHAFRARPGPLHMIDIGHAERAEAMAAELGHETIRAFAQYVRSIYLWWSGRPYEAADAARGASIVFEGAGRTIEWCEAQKFLGVALVFQGAAEEGLKIQNETLTAVRRARGTPFQVAHGLAYLGHCHRFLGDDDAAWADFTEARTVTSSLGNRGTAIHLALGLAEIAADRGDNDEALRLAGEALELIRAGQVHTYEPWAWTVAMRAHTSAGDVDSALECARLATRVLATVPPGETVRLAMELSRLAVVTGHADVAARLLGVVAATDDKRELPFPAPAERARYLDVERQVTDRLGTDVSRHINAGKRCSIQEAASRLLTPEERCATALDSAR